MAYPTLRSDITADELCADFVLAHDEKALLRGKGSGSRFYSRSISGSATFPTSTIFLLPLWNGSQNSSVSPATSSRSTPGRAGDGTTGAFEPSSALASLTRAASPH